MRVYDLDALRGHALAAKIAAVAPYTEIEIALPRIDDVDILFNVTPTGMLNDAGYGGLTRRGDAQYTYGLNRGVEQSGSSSGS